MDTRHGILRVSLLTAGLALGILTAFGVSGTATAHPHRSFDVTACVQDANDLVLTATWSRIRVTAWSYFIESTEGSGGVFTTVPAPGKTGTVTQTFAAEDVGNIQSVSATVFRAAGPNYREAASITLTQPASGWPNC